MEATTSEIPMKSYVLNALALCLLALLLILQFSSSKRLNARIVALEESSRALEESSRSLEVASQQQTAVMHRALGKVIPVVLPESLEASLSSLEQRINDPKSWPRDLSAAQGMQKDLDDLVGKIPVWAEEDLLPRLNVLRWGVFSAHLIANSKDARDADPADVYDEISTTLDAAPAGAPEVMVVELGKALAEQQKRSADQQKSQLSAARKEFVIAARNRLDNALAEKDALVRQVLVGRIFEDVVTQRLSLVDEPDTDTAIGNELTGLMERLRTEAEKDSTVREQKWRDYQKWALEQVKRFNDAYGADDDNRAVIRDSMVKYLLPISTEHLDSAVARLYEEAFNKGWKRLDGRKDTNGVDLQFYLASREAVAKKHKP